MEGETRRYAIQTVVDLPYSMAVGRTRAELVVTYCRSGMQASMAYYVARHLGYETRMYDGSFLDWSRRPELPVER